MGPQMCDNFELQNKDVKDQFIEILKDYKAQINSKIKQEKNQMDLAKSRINQRIEELSEKVLRFKREADRLIPVKEISHASIDSYN